MLPNDYYGLRVPNQADAREAGWQEFHQQMFDLSSAPSSWIRFKMLSTGVNIARQLLAARNRGRAAWVERWGSDPVAWPLAHPPVVLWLPYSATAACLRCLWIDDAPRSPEDAAASAREHARSLGDVRPEGEELLTQPLAVFRRDAPWDEPGPSHVA